MTRLEILQEVVRLFFPANSGFRAVARNNDGFVGEGNQLLFDGGENLLAVAAGQVGAADGAGEEDVAGDDLAVVGEPEGDVARGVAGEEQSVPVREIMRADPITVNPDTSTLTAVRLLPLTVSLLGIPGIKTIDGPASDIHNTAPSLHIRKRKHAQTRI